MKKILFFLLLLFCIPYQILAITGDGSIGSPYSGPLTSNMNWSGTVYVNGDVTVDGFTLTISPGSIIVFLASGSDIIITGTGVLTASGSVASMIRFTADFNNNGIYGETGERWGHISFQNMTAGFTGASLINYCIVEFGQKNSGVFDVENEGGGIQTTYTYLTISNSIIRNNYAGFGGGIFVYSNASPSIISCLITNNTAGTTGGGILISGSPSSKVENCIIMKNTCTGEGGAGGVFVGGNSTGTSFYNCSIVSNIGITSLGINIRFYENYGINRPKFYNSIIWGSSNSIAYSFFQNPTTGDFNNCAIQGYTTGYTDCINLSGTNTDPTGPNFYNVTAGSEDYRILFISPCRDAGTSTGAPLTDFLGNPRVGPYDIGAYEVQYDHSSWTGATSSDWATASNWNPNIVPLPISHVIIPPATNNPSITVSDVTINDMLIESGSSLSVSNLRTFAAAIVSNYGTLSINNPARFNVTSFMNEVGAVFTVEPGSWATITTLTNNGTINLNSDNIDMFSLMFNTYSGTGTANIGLTLSGGGGTNNWKWHYVAVPANYRNNKTMFTDIDPVDLIQYDDYQIPNTLDATDNDGWVWHDGYVTGDPQGGPYSGIPFTDLSIGKGYGFYHPYTSAVVNFSNLSSLQFSLGPLTLQYNGDGKLVPGNYGFNLLGNSLTCGVDWNLVTETGNVNEAIYYTINYKIGMYVRDAPSGVNGATKDIPPLQGFLVKTNETGTYLNFSSAREHTGQPRYKKSLELKGSDSKGGNSIDPMIKLELNNSGNQDETLIWFNNKATNAFDGDFDASKLFSGGAFDQIYTWNGSQKFGISGIPFPTESVTIPVAVKLVNAGSNYKIIASQLQGLDNYKVTLTDKGNANFITDLKNTDSYTFSSDAGTFPDRFVLTIGTIATGVSDVIIPDKAFNVFAFDKTLNIDLLKSEWEGKSGTINIYNLTGRKVLQQNNVEWYKGDIKKIPLNLPQGIYIVEIKAENQKFVTKINIIK